MDLHAPMLRFQAEAVDDLEGLRTSIKNQLSQLTRSTEDSDGIQRGFGMTEEEPAVAQLAALAASLEALEHTAVLNLQRAIRKHPLFPWIKAQRGLGEKQVARLLAAIGDPYWNDLHERPRTVSELWAYSGYHTLLSEDPGPEYNVAAKRKRGVRANWSATAKMRAYLIAESVVKSGGPWREVYDKRRAKTAVTVMVDGVETLVGRPHRAVCVRCGPAGKPALVGSPWSKGHQHADALRITAKEILKGLYNEAKRLHELDEKENEKA